MNAILLRRLPGNRISYSVLTPECYSVGVSFREAMTAVVRFVLRDAARGKEIDLEPLDKNEVCIERIDAGNFCIHRHNGEFMPQLCADETIAFVTTYLLTGMQLFSGFQNYQANIARFTWREPAVIEGLLAN